MERRDKRALWIVASAAFVPAAAGATWWLAGDLSEAASSDLDYTFRAPETSPATQTAIGLVLALFVIGYWIAFVLTSRRSRTTMRWLPVVISLTLAGAFIGYGARVVTAGVIGANIGGGLVLMATPFVLLGLLGFAVVSARTLVNRPSEPSTSRAPSGWYADPEYDDRHRWWDGNQWAPSLPTPHQSEGLNDG